MGVPIVLFEELVVINNWRRVPIISLMYICFILYSFGRVIARLMILSEAMVAILLITYVAYISLYRRLEQNETIRQTNLKLSIANQKIADLTADKVRQAVARELHDTLTQDVVGINMQLSAIKMLADQREYTKMNQMLDQTEVMATEAIKHSRDLIKQYRENENHHQKESLKVVSQTIVDRFAEEYGLQTEFMMDRDVSVASEELHDMGRVLNEALMNVVKHGQTNTATVKITVDYGLVTMVVTNQGRFLKRPQVKNGHYGLQNMKERVEKYGGRLTFHPVSKNGVEVIATFLIEEEQ